MSQKKHEALDECNFHQNVAQPHGNEIKQRSGRLSPAVQRQRQNQKSQHRRNGDHQDENQNQHSQVYLPVDCLLHFLAQNLSGFEREKEKWRIVGNWRHVVGITLRKSVRIIARNQIGKWIAVCPASALPTAHRADGVRQIS